MCFNTVVSILASAEFQRLHTIIFTKVNISNLEFKQMKIILQKSDIQPAPGCADRF